MVRIPGPALNGDVPDTNLPVITRPRTGAMVGGVCAGLARRWQVDPNLLRIAVVVLAFFGGIGLIAYGTGLLLMPREGSAEPLVRRLFPFTRRWSSGTVVIVTITVAALLVAVVGTQGIGIGPLAVIFAIWFFGFRGRNSRRSSAPPAEPTPFERAADTWRQRLAEQQTPGYEQVALPAPERPRWTQPYTDPATDLAVRDDDPVPVVQPRTRRRWRAWWLAFSLVGLGVLGVSLLGVLGLPATPLAYAAAVLGGLGLALLTGVRGGRAPLLLPATLIAALVAGSLMVHAHGVVVPELGEQHHVYTTGAELPPSVTLQAGELTLDLSRLQLSADQDLTVHVGTGQLNLRLPGDVASDVTWKVGTGEYSATGGSYGESHDGFDISGSTSYPADSGGTTPTLHVRVSVDLGEVDVTR